MAGERALPGLGLTGFWDYGSDLWDTGMNENLRRLSVLCQGAVLDTVASEPATPADGDIYLLTGGANANSLAVRDNGAWVYYAPSAGWLIYDRAAGQFLQFDGTAWSPLSTGSAGGGSAAGAEPLGIARFTPPPSSGWVGLTGEGAALEAGYDAATRRVRIRKAGNTASTWRMVPVAGGADFDKVFRLSANHVAKSFAFTGVSVRNTATDKIVTVGNFRSYGLYRQHFTGATFDNEVALDGARFEVPNNGVYYVRLTRSGDTLEARFSTDGIEWTQALLTETISTGWLGGDVDQIGLYCQTTGIPTGDEAQVALIGLDDGPQAELLAGAAGISLTEQLADYTVTDADLSGGKVVEMNVAAANTVTVPAGLTGGEPLTVIQTGAGQTSLVAGAGVSILSADGALKLRAQYSSATLIPKGADTYYLVGDLTV